MDATFRWETYDRTDKFGVVTNKLEDARSKEFMQWKRTVEARVLNLIYQSLNSFQIFYFISV